MDQLLQVDFYEAVKPHIDALNAWIDEGEIAGAKRPFSFMLKAYCEAAPPLPPEKRMPVFRKKKSNRPTPMKATNNPRH